jgi:uncharacterized protein (DUF1810 family)
MSSDPHNLQRFISAQKDVYESALCELRAGHKHGHWMWFVFPQLDGLGSSSTARHYAIKNLDEAVAYLAHPVLGSRLIECCEALLFVRESKGLSARAILGTPDDLKLCSCATLFSNLTTGHPVFARIISQYYYDCPDTRTLELLRAQG